MTQRRIDLVRKRVSRRRYRSLRLSCLNDMPGHDAMKNRSVEERRPERLRLVFDCSFRQTDKVRHSHRRLLEFELQHDQSFVGFDFSVEPVRIWRRLKPGSSEQGKYEQN